jgi:hypothetical protein
MSIITNEERKCLFDNITYLLDEYDYKYTYDAINTVIDEWALQKKSLIEAFKKHPNYVDGKFMIAFNRGFERSQNSLELESFAIYMECELNNRWDTIPQPLKDKYKDEESYVSPNIYDLIHHFRTYTSITIDELTASYFEREVPELRIKAGQKTSRVVNKLCTYLGITGDSSYNRRFARYADAINPIIVNHKVVLSINPLDYLTMSFGNSWSSCHTIDKQNKRRMPHGYSGMYSSGTMSYMLDESSIVLYTVDEKYQGEEYWNQPKINRQMFHYAHNKLVQARLYPQSNDSDGSMYTPYRNVVQEIIATVFDFSNLWTNKKGTSAIYPYVHSSGTHYLDYCNFQSCNISFAKDLDTDGEINIGHDPICIECGCEHTTENNINCCHSITYKCNCCGYEMEEGDDSLVFIDSEPYCDECVSYCDECDEYYLGDNVQYVASTDRYVCNHCLDNYYVYCETCGEYHLKCHCVYVESVSEFVCDECLSAYYTQCSKCGQYYPNNDVDEHDICANCAKKENEEK